jgi:pilus assembly protein CpaB
MLKPEDIVARAVSAPDNTGAISADSPNTVRSLAGAMTKHAMAAGDPIRDGDVIRQSDHGFMAAALKPGMRAVTIGVDASSGSAGLVWPGDRVDLTLTQSSTDPALSPGRRVSAETILTNVRVIAIDSQLVAPTGGDGQNRTVTLEVKPEDVQRVSVAKRLGLLSLSVRAVSPDDAAGGNTTSPGNGPGPQGGSVYARDVSSALGGDPPPPPPPPPQQRTVHVFHGSADPKEFKY